MRRGLTTVVGLTAATGLLLGCSSGTEEQPAGEELAAQVVMLENDPALPLSPPAIATSPIDPVVVAGWIAADIGGDGEPRDPNGVELPEPQADKSYVFAAMGTSCLPAEDASLWRDGDDLRVVLDIPDDEVDCVVPNHAQVQFTVDSDLIAGVTTVNGDTIVDPAGPGEPIAEVMVGELFDDWTELVAVTPVEITETGGGEPILTALVETGEAENLDDVEGVLTEPVPDGMRRFAFLLRGCPGDSTILVVAPSVVSAERVGPGVSGCSEAEQFSLNVFDVPTDRLIPDTHPAVYR